MFVFTYFVIIFQDISLQLFPPTTNDNNCSNQTRYFGLLYRQLLPQFVNEIPNTPNANQNELMKMMDVFYPEITWFLIFFNKQSLLKNKNTVTNLFYSKVRFHQS